MNGSVVPMIEKPKADAIRKKIEDYRQIFYNGDKLSDLELDIERMYIAAKQEKTNLYKKRKSLRYKVRWTVSDLNRYQD